MTSPARWSGLDSSTRLCCLSAHPQAANPGCLLEDFVRWYSPRDWIEGSEAEHGGDRCSSAGGCEGRGDEKAETEQCSRETASDEGFDSPAGDRTPLCTSRDALEEGNEIKSQDSTAIPPPLSDIVGEKGSRSTEVTPGSTGGAGGGGGWEEDWGDDWDLVADGEGKEEEMEGEAEEGVGRTEEGENDGGSGDQREKEDNSIQEPRQPQKKVCRIILGKGP